MGDISLKPRPVPTGDYRPTRLTYKLVRRVLDSRRISYGEMSKTFESLFARMHACRYAVLSNSGTSSLQVALQALAEEYGWQDGEVIVPATTFVATPNIVRHCGLTPVFVDVDPLTYNMDMQQALRAINGHTRAIIPVHLAGQPANMTYLRRALALNYVDPPKIIEDSCETMFVRHAGQPVGSMGDVGCFSTYVAHLVVTGVGGIATTNNPRLAARMRSLVNHGLDIDQLNPDENFSPRPVVGRRFRFTTYGHSYRITEMEAALGLPQLLDAGNMLALRARNARHLTAGLKIINRHHGDLFCLPQTGVNNEHAWMFYPLALAPRDGSLIDKEPLMDYLNARQIETRDLLPLLDQPVYSYLAPEKYPVSYFLAKSAFYVGCHQYLEPEDIQYVVQTIQNFLDSGDKLCPVQ